MIYILDTVPTLTTKICPCLYPQNEYDFIWQKGLRRCNEGKDLQVRSCWLREGLKSSNECPYGRQKRRKYTQTQMMRPREDGSRSWGYAAPRPGAPGAPRIRKRQELLRQPSEGAGPCPHLSFRLQASRTGRGYVSEVFIISWYVVTCYGSPRTLTQGSCTIIFTLGAGPGACRCGEQRPTESTLQGNRKGHQAPSLSRPDGQRVAWTSDSQLG